MSRFAALITRGGPLNRLVSLALGGLALSLALIVGSSPAHAATTPTTAATVVSNATGYGPTTTVTVVSNATGYALDSSPQGLQGSVYDDKPNSGDYQKWNFWSAGNTRIPPPTSQNGKPVSPGGRSYATYVLQDVATTLCLDSDGNHLGTTTCTGPGATA